MSFPIFLLLALTAVVAYLILDWWLVWTGRRAARANRAPLPFTDSARRAFLSSVYDLDPDDFCLSGFDGYAFHFPRPVSFTRFTRVTAGTEQVVTRDPDQETSHKWRYQRMDGGPDNRYNGNTKTMYTERRVLSFSGPGVLRVRAFYPSREHDRWPAVERNLDLKLDCAATRLTRFLGIAAALSLAQQYAAFEGEWEKCQELRAELYAQHLVRDRARVVLQAATELRSLDQSLSDTQRSREEAALANAAAADTRMTELQEPLRALEARQSASVAAARQLVWDLEHGRTRAALVREAERRLSSDATR